MSFPLGGLDGTFHARKAPSNAFWKHLATSNKIITDLYISAKDGLWTPLHKTQGQPFTRIFPPRLKLSIIRILFRSINHPNTRTFGGAYSFQIIATWLLRSSLLFNVAKNEDTEESSLEAIHLLSSTHSRQNRTIRNSNRMIEIESEVNRFVSTY